MGGWKLGTDRLRSMTWNACRVVCMCVCWVCVLCDVHVSMCVCVLICTKI